MEQPDILGRENSFPKQDSVMQAMIDQVIETHREHVNSGMARLMSILNVGIEAAGEGAYIYDHENTRYLDCGGYCVFLLGRSHARLLAAATAQLNNVALSSRLLINQEIGDAARKLVSIAPQGLEYVWFANSGAEVVEAAIKICKINGRNRFIAMQGGFHGKTIGALSLTYNPTYRTPFLPLMPGVEFVPFGDIEALRSALVGIGSEAAVVMEPIQSEAGVIIPPPGYLKAVERICRESGALLIMDEISSGLGRTGEWWYCQSENVTPDVLLCGKALSGGIVPVSGLICTPTLYQAFNTDPLLHTSTFAGSPLVTSVVSATIELLKELDAPNSARNLGQLILSGIESILNRCQFSFIKEIRGRGLLIALEFIDETYSGEFLFGMIQRKVLVSHSLNAHTTVRLTPSLCLSNDDITYLLEAIESSLIDIDKRYANNI